MQPARLDRLSAILERFRISAQVCPAPSPACRRDPRDKVPNLFAASGALPLDICGLGVAASGGGLAYFPCGAPDDFLAALAADRPEGLVAAHVDIGGEGNPVARALPEVIAAPVAADSALKAVGDLLLEEVLEPRCGGGAVLDRLCEVLVIRLLRHAIRTGRTEVGLLAGLAHRGLCPALVAMHENPERDWHLESLAEHAAMSRTQFAKTFRDVVGTTPGGYLSAWRLTLAQLELSRGAPLKSVAGRVGFSSPAALSRAFTRHFGYSPRNAARRVA
ncbi:AraC family transcriptional regulator [Breoghania sp. L-A4]|uniref:helix-turn-helix transcriptional regulator n=1 Tax=Breoghania sp. L-A4 TaxID=2304600 RepID=UPI000E35D397|nr:AraC family transcriptional regulator [Breoghania sp. L-A4]AXS41171.1 AraC family transcriptional regulator [Breoghania sp. L-A4]